MASFAMKASEVLLERFFANFRSLYANQFDAQTALSKAHYRLCPLTESGETFVSCFVWHENLEEFLNHQQQFLMTARMTSLDGLDLIEVSPEGGDKPYKLLRVS